MPRFLESKLKREYPNNPHAVYGTLNKLGAMKGNKETKKGVRMESKHNAHERALRAKEAIYGSGRHRKVEGGHHLDYK